MFRGLDNRVVKSRMRHQQPCQIARLILDFFVLMLRGFDVLQLTQSDAGDIKPAMQKSIFLHIQQGASIIKVHNIPPLQNSINYAIFEHFLSGHKPLFAACFVVLLRGDVSVCQHILAQLLIVFVVEFVGIFDIANIDVPVTEDGIVDMEVVYQWYVGTPLMTELTNISKINELYWMADDKLNFEKEKVLRHSKLDDVLDQAMQVMQTLQDEDFRTSIETLAKTIPVA